MTVFFVPIFLLSQLFFGFFCWGCTAFSNSCIHTKTRILHTTTVTGNRSRFFRGKQRVAPGGPANHWVTEDIAHLGPRKCWHKSNGSVNIHNSESHVVANFERKSMNQSPNKKDKKPSFGEDSLNCFLI